MFNKNDTNKKLREYIKRIEAENRELKKENILLREHFESIEQLRVQYNLLIINCEMKQKELDTVIKDVRKLQAEAKKEYSKMTKSVVKSMT